MPRPLSIAMAFSAALHMAAFAIVDGLLSDEALPAITETVLLVSIEPAQTSGDTADDRMAAPATESSAVLPGEPSEASIASEQPSETVEPLAMVVAAETRVIPQQAADESATEIARETDHDDSHLQAEASSWPAETEVAAVAVVSTLSPSEPEPPPQAAFSPKQKKMLKRRVRKWAEELHELSDLASGLTWKYKGQEYLATFTQLPAANDMGIQRVLVEISTEEDGKRLTSEVLMKRLAFSHYAQFINRWDPNVVMHNDELDGRFHSNTGINLTYDRQVRPLFHGKVTTSSRNINVTGHRAYRGRDEIFMGGLQTGVRSIRLPRHFVPFPDGAQDAGDQVHHFDADTRISFDAEGSYLAEATDADVASRVVDLAEGTTYLIADEKITLHVRGTINGKVLVYSPKRIVIEGNLVYAQHPEVTPTSDDYLGLVSDGHVEIATPDITGPGDLTINAAIYAKRRFAVRRYRSGESALLDLYGSLSVGSVSATEPRYYTRIRFDPRLEELRPPGFPMTDRYEVETWDRTWQIETISH